MKLKHFILTVVSATIVAMTDCRLSDVAASGG
jgi:hypothetical protein